MPNELTPEGAEVLKAILEETALVREVRLDDTPPAMVFEAGEHGVTKTQRHKE
jgi:hypothetical protein